MSQVNQHQLEILQNLSKLTSPEEIRLFMLDNLALDQIKSFIINKYTGGIFST
ncbi:MAG: hypothetical protein EZS28_020171, partial [Streblomastix strix]